MLRSLLTAIYCGFLFSLQHLPCIYSCYTTHGDHPGRASTARCHETSIVDRNERQELVNNALEVKHVIKSSKEEIDEEIQERSLLRSKEDTFQRTRIASPLYGTIQQQG